jgi:hypothetical protein
MTLLIAIIITTIILIIITKVLMRDGGMDCAISGNLDWSALNLFVSLHVTNQPGPPHLGRYVNCYSGGRVGGSKHSGLDTLVADRDGDFMHGCMYGEGPRRFSRDGQPMIWDYRNSRHNHRHCYLSCTVRYIPRVCGSPKVHPPCN